jgi:hypothetical protein
MHDTQFPPGTPVCVCQTVELHGEDRLTEVVGVIEAWEDSPTGSWFARSKDGRLSLRRIRLRKADGETTLLVVDRKTTIARIEAQAPDSGT